VLNDLYNLKNTLEKDGVIFSFSGVITQDILIALGKELKNTVMIKSKLSTATKIFSIFVEQMQNITKYSDEKISKHENEISFGIVTVGYSKNDNSYYLMCGNIIDKTKTNSISEKLNRIKNMNSDELKEYYKKKIKENMDKDGKSAGLGFIEMARKSQKLDYIITSIDSKNSFFTIKTII